MKKELKRLGTLMLAAAMSVSVGKVMKQVRQQK